MPSDIRIYLDNPNNCYHPGEFITGRVECTFTKEKNIRAVLVKLKGKCLTSWTETESYYDDFFKEDRTREVPYSGEEDYINKEFNLAGRNNLTLPPGKHIYPFSYQLPLQIPSSYEDNNGMASVRYTVKAVLDCPWRFDIKSVAVFNVISLLDLNTIPRIMEPVEMSVDKVLCSCWCSNNDTLTFNFTLPTIGYTPGQNIKVGVYVQNLTNVSVQRARFKITQLTEYRVETPRSRVRNYEEIVAECFDGGIGAHGEKSWTASLFLTPEKSYPNMNDCKLINISYCLKGTLVIPYPHTNLSAVVPLKIGDVPLRGSDFNVSLGPPPAENERLPYIDATAPPSDNVSLNVAFGGRQNYGAISNGEMDFAAPPTYEEVIKSN